MQHKENKASITFGDENTVVLRRVYAGTPIVAKILGQDFDPEGNPVRVVLDRLIHKTTESSLGNWIACGAITTVLVAPDNT